MKSPSFGVKRVCTAYPEESEADRLGVGYETRSQTDPGSNPDSVGICQMRPLISAAGVWLWRVAVASRNTALPLWLQFPFSGWRSDPSKGVAF